MGLGISGQMVQASFVDDFTANNFGNVHHGAGLSSTSVEEVVYRDVYNVHRMDRCLFVLDGLDDHNSWLVEPFVVD